MLSKCLSEKSLVVLALGVAVGAAAVYASGQSGGSAEKKVKEEKEWAGAAETGVEESRSQNDMKKMSSELA